MSKDENPVTSRAMHGFSIPAYTYKSCACGQVWIGPAYACIDDNGYFWNCPGCAHRFEPGAKHPSPARPANDT